MTTQTHIKYTIAGMQLQTVTLLERRASEKSLSLTPPGLIRSLCENFGLDRECTSSCRYRHIPLLADSEGYYLIFLSQQKVVCFIAEKTIKKRAMNPVISLRVASVTTT